VGTGSRQENASNQNLEPFRFDSIGTERFEPDGRMVRDEVGSGVRGIPLLVPPGMYV